MIVRPFRGVSASDRLVQRRTDLIEAGFDVVGEGGLGELTMTAVCERAGLTQRYFYEQFRNRDEFLAALFRTVFEDFLGRAQVATESQPADLLSRARSVVEVMVDFFAADPRKTRVFSEAVGSNAVAAQRAESVRRLAEFAATQAIALDGPVTERARTRVHLAATIIVGGQTDAAAQWLHGTIDLPRDEFIEELAQVYVVAFEAARDMR